MTVKNRLRNVGAWFVAFVLMRLGFARRVLKKAASGEFILSIYFHAPQKELFEFCIKWLLKHHFIFLSQDDLYDIILQNRQLPKKAVVITVDDGWKSNEINIVEVANKYQVPVAIFVTTEAIEKGDYWWPYIEQAYAMQITSKSVEALKKVSNRERLYVVNQVREQIILERAAMTVDQVRSISKSAFITIGGHTVSHPILPQCEDDEVYYELRKSKEKIEEWTGKNVLYFAYPNGNYTHREIKYLEALNYGLAYHAKPYYLTMAALQKRYELPRFDVIENATKLEAICRILGIWQRFFPNQK